MSEIIRVLMTIAHDKSTPINIIGLFSGVESEGRLRSYLKKLEELSFIGKLLAEQEGRLILELKDCWIRFPTHKWYGSKKNYSRKRRRLFRELRYKHPFYRLGRLIRDENFHKHN